MVAEFSPEDTQKIAEIILQKDVFTLPEEPLDKRTLSVAVIEFCLDNGIIVKRGRRLFRDPFCLLPLIEAETLPVESLWIIFEPMLVRDIMGYDIVTHPGWSKLSLSPPRNKRPSRSHLSYMVRILERLHRCGYVDFKHIDDVWEIRRRVAA